MRLNLCIVFMLQINTRAHKFRFAWCFSGSYGHFNFNGDAAGSYSVGRAPEVWYFRMYYAANFMYLLPN